MTVLKREKPTRALDLSAHVEIRICHDFQNLGYCDRQACLYYHADKEEEALIRSRAGDLPSYKEFYRSVEAFKLDMNVCKDFLASHCFRRFCKFSHPLIRGIASDTLNLILKHKDGSFCEILSRCDKNTTFKAIRSFAISFWQTEVSKKIYAGEQLLLLDCTPHDYDLKQDDRILFSEL